MGLFELLDYDPTLGGLLRIEPNSILNFEDGLYLIDL